MSGTVENPHLAAQEDAAIHAAQSLIYSWAEYGLHEGNQLSPEAMPTPALRSVAHVVLEQVNAGVRSWPNIVPAFSDNEPIRRAFLDCCMEMGLATEPPHCARYVDTVKGFHGARRRRELGGRLMLTDDPEEVKAIMSELESINAKGTGSHSLLTFTHADDLVDTEGAFDFVEDVFTDGAASVIYGASNSGKTFFALDIAAHIATGEEWQEKEVEQGAVLYIALEGRQGAVNRIRAMKIRKILPTGAPLYACFSPVNLLDPKHPAAITRMIESITEAASMPVRLVIIDTMARAMAGGDENSGRDMGMAVESIDAIRAKTAAHVCIIHHCGKDAAKGARGHSSLRAAIDTEIEVIHPESDKYRTATIVKQRDLPTIAPLCFSLDPVEVGRNRRGKPITSCVVKAEDSIMAHTKGKPGAKKKFTCEMILELLPQPSVKAWTEAATVAHGMSPDTFGDRKRECASQWKNVGNQIVIKPLKEKELWGNG